MGISFLAQGFPGFPAACRDSLHGPRAYLSGSAYGWFSKDHVLKIIQDPGALNLCMHICIALDICWFTTGLPCVWIWDLRPSILNVAN